MTPGGRLAAAIEILDGVIAAARDEGAAADTLIARYFRERRYAGSKDRKAVRALVYEVIRWAVERPDSGRAAMVAYARAQDPELLALFGGEGHAPAAVGEADPDDRDGGGGAGRDWLTRRLVERFGSETEQELKALMARAPLDLRVNSLKATRAAAKAVLPPTTETQAPNGLRADEPFAVETHPAFHDGLVEIQDTGSQLACAACEARPGTLVIDLCAGAGGKTLALAAAMENSGRLVACDTDRGRLNRMPPRAERAGVTIVEPRLLNPGHEAAMLSDLAGAADVVLVDAPCSGTGTWRRNPEARWRLTPQRLGRLTSLQASILDVAKGLVRPGGRLAYVVCSLLPEEGERQVEAFLTRHAGWQRVAHERVLTPARDGTDGFFIAMLGPI